MNGRGSVHVRTGRMSARRVGRVRPIFYLHHPLTCRPTVGAWRASRQAHCRRARPNSLLEPFRMLMAIRCTLDRTSPPPISSAAATQTSASSSHRSDLGVVKFDLNTGSSKPRVPARLVLRGSRMPSLGRLRVVCQRAPA
jgi:hypothetical protein